MKKQMISLILAIALLFSLVPAVRAEEQAEPQSIEAQIRAYADSIDQSDATSTAAMALATHGMFGGGKTLHFTESSAMAALLLNSAQFQYLLVEGCTRAIRNMQELDLEAMENMKGSSIWDGVDNRISMTYYQNEHPGSTDWQIISRSFPVEWNSYDRSLEWMTGNTALRFRITRTAVSEDTAVYRVDCRVKDVFNFSTANSSGFKDFLSGIGMLLFQEFEWECNVSFTLKVPYSCPHGSRAYHWTYDAEKKEMISDGDGGYTENIAEHRLTDASRDYFALEETVRLLHDRPWVLEYDAKNVSRFSLAPLEKGYFISRPLYLHYGSSIIRFQNKRHTPVETEDGIVDSQYIYGVTKAPLSSLVPGSQKKLLTYRLENQVYPDGSNMVFLTILDPQVGTVLVDRFPMDDYSESYEGSEGYTLISEESDWISGRDFFINYIGNQAYYFKADHFDLRIWENGIGNESESYYRAADPVPATCTEAGYADHICAVCGHTIRESGDPATGHHHVPAVTDPTCTDGGFTTYTCACGDSYVSDYTDPLGHDLNDWTMTQDPACTEFGTEERWCQRCSHRESRTIDPLGHDLIGWTVTEDPSCTESGLEERWCNLCDYRESRAIDPTGHSYEATVIEPQCTIGGYTEYTCHCGDTYRTNYTTPTGHHYEGIVTEPGCTEGGYTTYTCACGDTYRSSFTSPRGHRYQGTPTAPTCTDMGFTTYTCECGDSYVSDYVDTLGHDYADGICARCGEGDPDYVKPNPFTDVPGDSFYYDPVLWAVENGITNGAAADTFNPGGECMRAHVVTFLWRAAGQPEPTSTVNPFEDVKETDFYYKAVLWAVENGITNGADAAHFNPLGICNRAQVVTFLHRAFGSPTVENAANPFTDVESGSWYAAPVLWAVASGITNGLSADSFGPNSPCNRAQVVTFLYRAYN